MRRKVVVCKLAGAVLLVGSGLVPAVAQAQETEGAVEAADAEAPNIVVIDTRRVVAESNVGRDISARAEAAAVDWEERITTARGELQALIQRRADSALTLSEAALADLDAEIERRTIDGQRLEEDARRALAGLSSTLMQELNARLGPSLESFAAERGFALIIDVAAAAETGLLYWSPSIDVTADFIASINGGQVAWKSTTAADGTYLGKTRVPEADSLRHAILGAAPRVLR